MINRKAAEGSFCSISDGMVRRRVRYEKLARRF